MMKKVIVVIGIGIIVALSVLLIMGKSQMDSIRLENERLTKKLYEQDKQIIDIIDKNIKLKSQVVVLENNKEKLSQSNNNMPSINDFLSKYFKSLKKGDLDNMKEYISSDLNVYKDKNIYYKKYEDQKGYILVDNERGLVKDRIVINGYDYDVDKDIYNVSTQQFILDKDGKPFSPASFVNYTIKKANGTWCIIDMEFDI